MVSLKNPSKLMFPADFLTKEHLLDYYIDIAPLMIPLIKDYILTVERFPTDIHHEGFIQKHAYESFPSPVVVKKKNKENVCMMECHNQKTLIYLIDQGCVAFHISLSKKQKINYPDRLIFDLDPSSNGFCKVKEGAYLLKDLLEDSLHLKVFLMTTGSKGLHLVIPIQPKLDFNQVRAFAKQIAWYICQKDPSNFTIELKKNVRGKRVFIDYLRNGYLQTSIAPYSIRALDGAPIAMPIRWDRLNDIQSQTFNVRNYKKEMDSKAWSSFLSTKQDLLKAIQRFDFLK